MGGRDASSSGTGITEDAKIMSAEYTYPPDCSDETDSEVDMTWAPGDGVCPSTTEFNHCWQSKRDEWGQASSAYREEFHTLQYYLEPFLNLHKDIPPFFQSPLKAVNIIGRPNSFLILRSSLQIRTTEDPDCSQPQKSIDYYQCLGSPSPVIYKVKSDAQLQATLPICTRPFRSGYYTSIVLSWSYIISCRWVEILQKAGEDSELVHNNENTCIKDAFWDIVTNGSWRALVRRGKGTFVSPWMLTDEAATKTRDNYVPVAPNPSLAFDILLDFCISEDLEYELLTGLVSVLLLTSRNAPVPSFAPPRIPTALSPQPRQKKGLLYDLLDTVDKCMALSSTQDALDSLACSALFDPSVPCNLMGAASLGVEQALSTGNEIDNRKLLQAITHTQPHLSLFWAAIVRSDLISYQSHGSDLEKAVVPRVHEFQTSFYCRPDTSVPWSPTPPFGQTLVKNLSLDVRTHFEHMHTPLSWAICYILESGEKVPASEQFPVRHFQVSSMCHSCLVKDPEDLPYMDQNAADEQSGMATSRLFNWHRSYDDGIWLDDGTRDIDQIRQLQNHAWIVDQFQESERDEAIKETGFRELNVEGILWWNNNVQECRRSEDFIEL
ncbi:hypothetical protein BDW42DRAFT_198856 [Aspergillus taichungensis]|uniref:Uncharacterized protein n=1 Tax=Aspergillus taichungensis TaxID=482145 RepID=A0A2J5I4W4_9EURO|nr:hypothetical protein BDW42DRAFT_198856 [Aspergillus taichungensis]